jgi:elongator complex protein 3
VDKIIQELALRLQQGGAVDNHVINRAIAKHVAPSAHSNKKYSKKRLMPYLLKQGKDYFGLDSDTFEKLVHALQVKPRRTASGVATITVMTKPWPCQSACIYCPNDLRMPKSYLSDEPVCQRAEFVYFDPYLQVLSRLRALKQMGHPTDKIELIILGGTFNDYPESYQIWYTTELFRALNDSEEMDEDADFEDVFDDSNPFQVINASPKAQTSALEREHFYQNAGLQRERKVIRDQVSEIQSNVNKGEATYNEAFKDLYMKSSAWQTVSSMQKATLEELKEAQKVNETAKHRVVGLVVETRPDLISASSLQMIRALGATKVQIGIQSLQESVLQANQRNISVDQIARAHALLRLFGFKIHVHFMLNLLGSNPQQDFQDYQTLVHDPRFMPDEVKLYPCMLVQGTPLVKEYETGAWKPYPEDDLVETLAKVTLETPRWMRISRMIRDISAHDILAGSKKSNLRQVVEQSAESGMSVKGSNEATSDMQHYEEAPPKIQEIRYREVSTTAMVSSELALKSTEYDTSIAKEHFLEWCTPEDVIAGFLRLSLPKADALADFEGVPLEGRDAMIREVHVYGKVAALGQDTQGAQHKGLGKKLIAKAAQIAASAGYTRLKVISAVGTKEYYRALGFQDDGLYQVLDISR